MRHPAFYAGLFDGDGHLNIGKQRLRAQIVQDTDRWLSPIHAKFGGSINHETPKYQTVCKWYGTSYAAYPFLEWIALYSIKRHSEIYLALELWRNRKVLGWEYLIDTWKNRTKQCTIPVTTFHDEWLNGFFCADGHIRSEYVEVAQKRIDVLELIQNRYGGKIYVGKDGCGRLRWHKYNKPPIDYSVKGGLCH